jgi:hypothetical protein
MLVEVKYDWALEHRSEVFDVTGESVGDEWQWRSVPYTGDPPSVFVQKFS